MSTNLEVIQTLKEISTLPERNKVERTVKKISYELLLEHVKNSNDVNDNAYFRTQLQALITHYRTLPDTL